MTDPDKRWDAEQTSVFPAGLVPGDNPEPVAAQTPGVDVTIAPPLTGLDAIGANDALLVIKRGPDAGTRFLLNRDEVTAGRHPSSDICLDDITVSRQHARFTRTDQGFEVTDVGSLNGTYINRESVDTGLLSNGDEVQIGKFRLVYLTGDDVPGRAQSL